MPDNPKLSAIALLILRASLRSEAERGEAGVTSGLTDPSATPAAGSGSGDEAGRTSVIVSSFDEAGGGVSSGSGASTSSSLSASGPLVPRGDFVFSEVDMGH